MKPILSLLIISFFLITSLVSQDNNTLRGKMLFLSSGKTPAQGVTVSGSILEVENTNTVYTTDDGSYVLIFPKARDGHRVNLSIGEEDQHGKQIEVVNEKEVEICRISADYQEEFEIIVCPKGFRDLAAQKYYKIIKTSSDLALAEIKKELDVLLAQQEKDYNLISEYSKKITKLEKQADSLNIYKAAFDIASINKDNASKRVLRYLQLLDEGKSIQEAREALSIKEAVNDLNEGIALFNAAVEELNTRAIASFRIFDYPDAIQCFDTILRYSEMMQIDRLVLSNYYRMAGHMSDNGGKFESAIEYYQKSVSIKEELLDSNNTDIALIYGEIAWVMQRMSQYEDALAYYEKAIKIQSEVDDAWNQDLANSYNQICLIYRRFREFDTALEYSQKAIAIQEELLDSLHPDLAASYNNAGLIYLSLNKLELALEYYQKSLDIKLEIYDPKHPYIATTYANISDVYASYRKYDKAIEYGLKAFEIRKENLNPLHPDVAYSYNHLGWLNLLAGNNETALEYSKKSLYIREQIVHADHVDLSKVYHLLGVAYGRLGENELSLEYNKKTLRIRKLAYDSLHPIIANAYNSLGVAYSKLKYYDLAIESHNKAIAIREETLKPDHPNLAWSYNNLGFALVKEKRFDEAHTVYEKHESIHPEKGISFRNWGMYYAEQGKSEEALENLEKAVDLGYNNLDWFETESSIDFLREDPRFIDIITLLEKQANEKKN